MDTAFKGNIGSLSAPDVVIEVSDEKNHNTYLLTIFLERVKQINRTAERDNIEGARSVIKFKQNGIDKKVLIRECRKKGYTLNMSWEGDIMVLEQNIDGEIEVGSEKYNVYYLDAEVYKSEKTQRKVSGKGVILKDMTCMKMQKFEEYFGEEQ